MTVQMVDRMILVVDDEPSMRKYIAANLAVRDYRVVAVGDGAEALSRLGQGGVALVILDFVLPGADGLEVLLAAREDPRVHVIVMSAAPRELEEARAQGWDADAYLLKPFSVGELLTCVRAVLPGGP